MGSSVSIARIFAQKSQLKNLLRPKHLVHLVEGFAANRSDWLERDSMAMGIILSAMGLSSELASLTPEFRCAPAVRVSTTPIQTQAHKARILFVAKQRYAIFIP